MVEGKANLLQPWHVVKIRSIAGAALEPEPWCCHELAPNPSYVYRLGMLGHVSCPSMRSFMRPVSISGVLPHRAVAMHVPVEGACLRWPAQQTATLIGRKSMFQGTPVGSHRSEYGCVLPHL